MSNAINEKMCTEECTCQNDQNQTLKKLYDTYDEETFNSFGRTKEDNRFIKDGVMMYPLRFQVTEAESAKTFETLLQCQDFYKEKGLDDSSDEEGISK